MNILNTTPTEITPAQQAANQITNQMTQARRMLGIGYNSAIQGFKNPNTTPQAVFDVLGESSTQYLAVGQATGDFISCLDYCLSNPASFADLVTALEGFRAANHVADFEGIEYPDHALAPNANGTVTVSADPYKPVTY